MECITKIYPCHDAKKEAVEIQPLPFFSEPKIAKHTVTTAVAAILTTPAAGIVIRRKSRTAANERRDGVAVIDALVIRHIRYVDDRIHSATPRLRRILP